MALDANDYNNSDVREFLNWWAMNRGIINKEASKDKEEQIKNKDDGYYVKGYPYLDYDRTRCTNNPVIHRFDTRAEADFFMTQIAKGELLEWGANAPLHAQKQNVGKKKKRR